MFAGHKEFCRIAKITMIPAHRIPVNGVTSTPVNDPDYAALYVGMFFLCISFMACATFALIVGFNTRSPKLIV